MRLILALALAVSTWPVESIRIEGLKNYTREQVLAVLGLKVGDKATATEFDAARHRLLATGVFETVGMRYGPGPQKKGYEVTFDVSEAGPLFPVRFEDLGAPDQKLRDALKRSDPFFGPKVPGTEPLIDRYAKTLEAVLNGAKVKGRLEPDDNQQLVIVFRPAAAPPAVARVRFTGNTVVPSTTLENAINAVAIGVPYRESRFRQILDTQIRPIYEARGRVRVAFPQIKTEPDPSVKGVVVTVAVDESTSYSVGDIAIQGTSLRPEDAKKLFAVKAGDVFNVDAVQAGLVNLENRVRRDGYMHVNAQVDRRIDDKAKKVNLTVRVNPGPQYTFGALAIEGLDIFSEPEIRKIWSLKPGQPFDSDYPDYFLKRIREEGIFDNLGETKAVQKRNDDNHTVDVTLFFKGSPPKPKKNPWDR